MIELVDRDPEVLKSLPGETLDQYIARLRQRAAELEAYAARLRIEVSRLEQEIALRDESSQGSD
jgi:hypothetical protein